MDFSHNTLLERFLGDEAVHPDVIVKPRIHGKPMGLAYESIRDFIEKIYFDKYPVKQSILVLEIAL